MTSDNIQKEECDYLESYNAKDFDRPSTSVDNVIYTIINNALHVLIVKRSNHPFKDQWALVGGFVDLNTDNNLEMTAKRKLKEKTGVNTPYLEQFSTIGNKDRDPRGWSVTTVYFALLPSENITLNVGKGANDIKWAKIDNGKISETLAFDHSEILRECTQRLRSKALYTSLPLYLMPEKFTLHELQEVYHAVLSSKMDPKSFRRRMLTTDLLEETAEMRQTGRRPAMLYRVKNDQPFFFTRTIEGI